MALVSGAKSPLYAQRRRRNGIAMALAYAATAFGLTWLVLILAVLLWNGFSGLSLRVFTEMTPPPGAAGRCVSRSTALKGTEAPSASQRCKRRWRWRLRSGGTL